MSNYPLKVSCCLLLFFLFVDPVHAQNPTWLLTRGTEGRFIQDISRSISNPDSIYALADGLFLSTDGGQQWDSIGLGVCCGALGVDPIDSRRLFLNFTGLPFDGNEVRLSTDRGQTWSKYDDGLCHEDLGCEAPFFTYNSTPRPSVYTTLNPAFILRSVNGGAHWDAFSAPPARGLWSIALSSTDSSIIYGGFSTPVRVLRSDDHGITWADLPFPIGMTEAAVYLATDPRDHDIVYAGVLGYGFFKTWNGGQDWEEINTGIPSDIRRMKAMVVNPVNPDNILVGMEDGFPFDAESDLVFVTENGGAHWSRMSAGLPDAGHVRALSIDPGQPRVLAAVNSAEGSGIYQLSLPTSVQEDPPEPLFPSSLSQNSPNPFNAETTIRFTLAARSRVRINVFSIPGELVKVLVDGEMDRGEHHVSFHAGGLSTGVYFYTLETDHSRLVRRMILLR